MAKALKREDLKVGLKFRDEGHTYLDGVCEEITELDFDNTFEGTDGTEYWAFVKPRAATFTDSELSYHSGASMHINEEKIKKWIHIESIDKLLEAI